MKFENPESQRALEEAARKRPGSTLKVVRRYRLFGEKAIRGDLASLAGLVRGNGEFLRSRPGRLAIYPETDEEKADLDDLPKTLGELWEREG